MTNAFPAMLNRAIVISLLTYVILSACGCTSQFATVTGQITLAGEPLTTGNVSFHPVSSGAVAVGTIQANGSYSVATGSAAGLPPGEYIVTIVATKPIMPTPENSQPVPELLTLPKYGSKETSDLRCTLKAGANRQNFDLQAK